MICFIVFADLFVYTICTLFVLYLLFFAICSIKKTNVEPIHDLKKNRFLVLFPAYKEDSVIINSVKDFFEQDYPKGYYHVMVISDQMKDETNETLRELGSEVLEVTFSNSSKAKALNFAMDALDTSKYDLIVIMDADNCASKDLLQGFNNQYLQGFRAIQAHRTAKNIDTDMALLDAVSEEINNSIFRKGHVNVGISSALIGSGMAFDKNWFVHNVKALNTAGEDKELELLLLQQQVFIQYCDKLRVYDEKTRKEQVFYNQRRRWLAAQYDSLHRGLQLLPEAVKNSNLALIDKVLQWFIPSRLLLMGFVGIFSLAWLIFDWVYAIKWIALLVILIAVFVIAIPQQLKTYKLIKAIIKLPYLFVLMFLNLFRMKGMSDKFVHTKKEG